MAALESNKPNSTSPDEQAIKFDGTELSFVPRRCKRWYFRVVKTNNNSSNELSKNEELEFWIGDDKSKEKITKITIGERTVTVQMGKKVELGNFNNATEASLVKKNLIDLCKGNKSILIEMEKNREQKPCNAYDDGSNEWTV